MRKFKLYILENNKGEILAKGTLKEVMNVCHGRYVYQHIYDDVIYTDGTYINKDGQPV
jgi:hypothetical protein